MGDFLTNISILIKHYKATSQILRRIFKYPLTLDMSREVIQERLGKRQENFIEMMEEAVFAYPDSPYRILMQRAGISLEDVKGKVGEKGIEPTLKFLFNNGVYIDILEFKGKKDVVRGKDIYRFKERDFSNPFLTEGVSTRSGGTRSKGTKLVVPLEYIEEHNPYGVLASYGLGLVNKPAIVWLPILPAGEGLFFNLRFAAMGHPPVKWFSQVDSRFIKPSAVERIKTKSSVWMARLYGKKMPAPHFIPIRNTVEIARWMRDNIENKDGYSVVTYASSALRLVIEAERANIDLGRTVFLLMGEPLTEKIKKEIEGYGCNAYSLYGCNELMIIGQGCGKPDKPDDMHFCSDKLAVIQYERGVQHTDQLFNAFLFTTLLKTSSKIFLNTETGDYGVIEKRTCGCYMEDIGFTEHIHSVRSFEKLTAEGATFIASDLLPLIQSILPSEFGGDATDYQFLEESDSAGIPKLYMVVSPEIGKIDEERLKGMVFDTLTKGEYSHTYSQSYWRQAGTLEIKRMHPIPTVRGKVMPLFIRRR